MSHRKIKNVMSTEVATVRKNTPFKEVVRVLDQQDVGAVPVVDADRRVLGVVSQADVLVKQTTQEPTYLRRPLAWLRTRETRRAKATTAGRLMTTPAVTIDADATVVRAAWLMYHKNIKRLPVVGSDGTLIGIVSRKDLLTVFLRKDEDIRTDIVEHVFEHGIGLAVNPATVTITVHDGEVTLDGQVELKSQIPLVEQMTRHIDGVVDVTTSLAYLRDDSQIPDPMPIDVQVPRIR